MGSILVALIRVYQTCISPFIGAHCRFTPTCSTYAVEAIQRYGAFRGMGYAFWRLLRCQPFCNGGYDPVP